ncbi:DoxX family protein [Sphingobacterium sp. SGG-5]|uniref:DoxX family protein n=1 Tax=Sphingobacterium sp. SGG-5 TaxID=2710881 RepID=UPI0013EA8644|nr:DoxX family protein [Sphingobacterium sp. SGG-5]NGM61978.1 DoxX family protein [Sphingobacterium sp. SGG-5]
MTKRTKIMYWIATVWFAVAMIASGIQQIFTIGGFVEIMQRLGFPIYFSVILGVWKIVGVVVILLPKFPLLKEWAYAGFFFVMSGAIVSHLAAGDKAVESFVPMFLLVLMVVSWYLRPTNRKCSVNALPGE